MAHDASGTMMETKSEYISRIRTHTRRVNFRGIWRCRISTTLATGVCHYTALTDMSSDATYRIP